MKALARAVLAAMAFLELSEEPAVEEDAAVAASESVAAELQRCSKAELAALREVIAELKRETSGREREFYGQFMEAAGLEGNKPPAPKKRRKPRTRTPLEQLTLEVLYGGGDHATVARLLKKNPRLADADLGGGDRPLHMAALHGFTPIVQTLLDAGADPNARGAERATPLHKAVINGHKQVAALLLDAGADPNLKNEQGETALALAKAMHLLKKLGPLLKKHGGRL
jgi:hypothetical protein